MITRETIYQAVDLTKEPHPALPLVTSEPLAERPFLFFVNGGMKGRLKMPKRYKLDLQVFVY